MVRIITIKLTNGTLQGYSYHCLCKSGENEINSVALFEVSDLFKISKPYRAVNRL